MKKDSFSLKKFHMHSQVQSCSTSRDQQLELGAAWLDFRGYPQPTEQFQAGFDSLETWRAVGIRGILFRVLGRDVKMGTGTFWL